MRLRLLLLLRHCRTEPRTDMKQKKGLAMIDKLGICTSQFGERVQHHSRGAAARAYKRTSSVSARRLVRSISTVTNTRYAPCPLRNEATCIKKKKAEFLEHGVGTRNLARHHTCAELMCFRFCWRFRATANKKAHPSATVMRNQHRLARARLKQGGGDAKHISCTQACQCQSSPLPLSCWTLTLPWLPFQPGWAQVHYCIALLACCNGSVVPCCHPVPSCEKIAYVEPSGPHIPGMPCPALGQGRCVLSILYPAHCHHVPVPCPLSHSFWSVSYPGLLVQASVPV